MDDKHKPISCEDLIEYSLGHLNDVDRKRFEHHLATCVACKQELAELETVWSELPATVDLVDPPADMKQQVFHAIFAEPRHEDPPIKEKPATRSAWFYLMSAVIAIALLVGAVWNDRHSGERDPAVQIAAAQPSEIENLVWLAAENDAADSAYGVACVVRQGVASNLVVYIFNAKANQGEQVYQVWLVQNAERTNAGTLRVGEDGIGVLTYPIRREQLTFHQIGITLEPDAGGEQPRGRKMFASTDYIYWN